jgi:hypothetical protein
MLARSDADRQSVGQSEIQLTSAECLAHRFALRDHDVQFEFRVDLSKVGERHLEPVCRNVLDEPDPPSSTGRRRTTANMRLSLVV